jgi:hypothetical protein
LSEGRVVFADWVGEAVIVLSLGGRSHADYGILEEVNDWGLVITYRRLITWATEAGEWGGQDERNISELKPWHIISSVRVLEPEEKEAHGL